MVWDMFAAHLRDSIKRKVGDSLTDMCVIPGGLTSQLQPLDVCLNKPFKDRMRAMWSEWIASDAVTTTNGGNPQKPKTSPTLYSGSKTPGSLYLQI